MSEKYRLLPKKTADGYLVDLTQTGSPFLEGLTEPVRVVKFNIGPVTYLTPRSANDPTPDNIVELSGLFHNLEDGRVGKKLEEVV